jgi:maltooligosyltrehalose trehalohydrolase
MTRVETRPVIFISYAYADEPEKPRDGEVQWLSFVRDHLRPAVRRGAVEIWADTLLRGGDDWDPKIERKLRECDVFVLLVSRHSASSDYVVDQEIAIIRERQKNREDVHFYPLVLTPTSEAGLDVVRDKNLRPRSGKPFSSYSPNDRDQHMADAANEIAEIAAEIATRKSAPAPPPSPTLAPVGWTLPIGAQPDANGTRFRVWAADRKRVEVVVMKPDGDSAVTFEELAPEGDGSFSRYIEGVSPGDRYKYRLDGDENLLFPDPASRYQPEGVHGPSQVVDPTVFDWTDQLWRGVKLEDLVLYELHVGAATPEGTFDALITRLGAIRELGVTAILLMAVADFAGHRNWGYDGVDLFAPARVYGGPEALRRLVDAAHARQLGVILDVVFNHLGPDGNYLKQFSSSYFTDTHKTPWGEALNYAVTRRDSPVRDFVVANACYWATEYHLDGLRLDAIQAIKDTENPHIIAEITSGALAIREHLTTPREFLVIAEDEFNDPKLVNKTQSGFGLDGIYADDFHHQLHVALTAEKTGYYVDYAGTAEDLVKTLRQGWWFTGQLSQWRKDSEGKPMKVGKPADQVPLEHFIYCIQNHDQVGNRPFGERRNCLVEPEAYRAASALLLLCPYTPLLFMGQEWAASTPFCYFTDHDEELGRSVETGRLSYLDRLFPGYDRGHAPKPQDRQMDAKLRWDERSRPTHASILRLYRDLLSLRRERRALRHRARGSFDARSLTPDALALRREDATREEVLVAVVNLRGRLTFDLRDDLATRARSSGWNAILDTEDPKYGGYGGAHRTDGAML